MSNVPGYLGRYSVKRQFCRNGRNITFSPHIYLRITRGRAFQPVVYSGLSISLRIAKPTSIPWPAKNTCPLPVRLIRSTAFIRASQPGRGAHLCLETGKISQHDTGICVPVAVTPDARKRTLGGGNDVPAVLSGYQ